MLVFQDAEMCHTFDVRSRVRYPCWYGERVAVLRQVWRFMLPGKGMPSFPVFEDNRGAVQLSQNPVSNSDSRRIYVRHHFLRELVRQRDISVNHVSSEYQHGDILTKALPFKCSCSTNVS